MESVDRLSGMSARDREKKAISLLLRRLSANIGLTVARASQNRDRIGELVLRERYEQALELNLSILRSALGEPTDGIRLQDLANLSALAEKFMRSASIGKTSAVLSHIADENTINELCLDRALVLALSGQPAEADAVVAELKSLRKEAGPTAFDDALFEVEFCLAELIGSKERSLDLLVRQSERLFARAMETGDETALLEAVAVQEDIFAASSERDDKSELSLAERKAAWFGNFGRKFERSDFLSRSSRGLHASALAQRKAGSVQESYRYTVAALNVDGELANMSNDFDEIHSIAKRYREIIELPDTMLAADSRNAARFSLGRLFHVMNKSDRKLITARKSFSPLEAAARGYAALNRHSDELRSWQLLADAKALAAEIAADTSVPEQADSVLAEKYGQEAIALNKKVEKLEANG